MVCMLVLQSCPAVCNPMDCSPPDSSLYGLSRQEYWIGLPFPSAEDLPVLGIKPRSPSLQAGFFFFFFYHLNHQESHNVSVNINQNKNKLVAYAINLNFGLFKTFF